MNKIKIDKLKLFKAIEIILWLIFAIVVIMAVCGGGYILSGDKTNPDLERIAEIFLALSPIIAILNVPLLFLKIKGIIKTHKVASKLEGNLEATKNNKMIKAAKDLHIENTHIENINKKMSRADKEKFKLKLIEKFLTDLGIFSHDLMLVELLELLEKKASNIEIKNFILSNSCTVIVEENIKKLKNLF